MRSSQILRRLVNARHCISARKYGTTGEFRRFSSCIKLAEAIRSRRFDLCYLGWLEVRRQFSIKVKPCTWKSRRTG
jgi:hypothetical protein